MTCATKDPMPRHGGSNTASDARREGVDPPADLRDRRRVRVSDNHENRAFFPLRRETVHEGIGDLGYSVVEAGWEVGGRPFPIGLDSRCREGPD